MSRRTTMLSSCFSLLVLFSNAYAFFLSGVTVSKQRQQSSSSLLASVRDATALTNDMRAELTEIKDADLILEALRGRNINNDDSAIDGLQVRLVDIASREDDALPLQYDPDALKKFFKKRPRAVATRILQVSSTGFRFALDLFFDNLFKRMKDNPDREVKRAGDLRDLLTKLGPFYIKIGQALSIRPDILSPRSMVELQQLCDKVPSFDTKVAFATIERELGLQIEEVFSEISSEPVAAASLGQVYKATLRETGETVAVKVQRPAVLETVSLDLYLAREAGLLARNFPALVSRLDPVALLDEFAFRFYQELDYNLECQNGIRIADDMKVLPMVVIPRNYPKYTSRRVHVAQWIEGEKLSQSTADNVGALVNLGVITYLTQLLDTGFFHADPHPGNMLRTTDGKLAVLDFGLMTEITEDQKYGMIEAIAHLINRDYSEIGNDFINLDFIPKGTDTDPIVPALAKVFDVALAGGGAKSINFQELSADLAEITFEYPFRIPPYFALIIRAISVLEGIALVGNPNFAIIDEAYPYIARKLLTDKSPRLRAALRYMVYGRGGDLNAENLIDLLQALEKFVAVRNDGDGSAFKNNGIRGYKFVGSAGDFRGSQRVDTTDREVDGTAGRFRLTASSTPSSETTQKMEDQSTVRKALNFFFSAEGEVFREFILEEVVSVVDTLSRDASQELARRVGLGNFPFPSILRAINPELSAQDKRRVQQIQKLVRFLLGDFEGVANTTRLQSIIPVIRSYSSELREFGILVIARLTEKNLGRGIGWASQQLNNGSRSARRSIIENAL